eukprot:GILK01002043.1.p1 GENE.GILK01002043.1~~GILK01002043.1.p1  ORF type:complete len:291 (-),score=49.09 GILK01002043.1:459-1331(-)
MDRIALNGGKLSPESSIQASRKRLMEATCEDAVSHRIEGDKHESPASMDTSPTSGVRSVSTSFPIVTDNRTGNKRKSFDLRTLNTQLPVIGEDEEQTGNEFMRGGLMFRPLPTFNHEKKVTKVPDPLKRSMTQPVPSHSDMSFGSSSSLRSSPSRSPGAGIHHHPAPHAVLTCFANPSTSASAAPNPLPLSSNFGASLTNFPQTPHQQTVDGLVHAAASQSIPSSSSPLVLLPSPSQSPSPPNIQAPACKRVKKVGNFQSVGDGKKPAMLVPVHEGLELNVPTVDSAGFP